MAKKHSTKGLDIDRKNSIWSDPRTLLIQALAFEGFTHRTIQDAAGIGVAYRIRRLGISTSEVRRAETDEGRARLEAVMQKFQGRLTMAARKASRYKHPTVKRPQRRKGA